MPTTYKTLGQTTATAVSSSTVLNAISYGDFELITSNPSAATTITQINTSSIYSWSNNAASSAFTLTTSPTSAIASGTKAIRWTNSGSTSAMASMAFGTSPATTAASSDTTTNITPTTTTVSINANTLYYYTISAMAGYQLLRLRLALRYYNSSGTILSVSTQTFSSNVATTLTRYQVSDTSPAGAAYVIPVLLIENTDSTGFLHYFDALVMSTSSSTAIPSYTQTNNTLTAPYDKYFTNYSATGNEASPLSDFLYAPPATDLYTVPSSTQAVVSTVTITNPTTASATYRIYVLPSGQTLGNKNIIAFDTPIGANSFETVTIGLTLNAGDKIQVGASTSNVSFSAFGSEIS